MARKKIKMSDLQQKQALENQWAFDKDVKLVLSCTLSRLLVGYGTGKD